MFVIGLEATPEAAFEAAQRMEDYGLYPEGHQCLWMGWDKGLAPLLTSPFTRILLLDELLYDLQLSPERAGEAAVVPDATIRDLAERINEFVPKEGNKKRGKRKHNGLQPARGFA
jgi:hypothetical protein